MSAVALRAGRFRLRCRALQEIVLPHYAGSTLRGAFGHGLKRAVCITGERNCKDCLLYRSCVYPYVFETPPPVDTNRMRLYPAAPHPFVIESRIQSDRKIVVNQPFEIRFTLVGRAIGHLPYALEGFRCAGRSGLGCGRGRFGVVGVDQRLPGVDRVDARNRIDATSRADATSSDFGTWISIWGGRGAVGLVKTPALNAPDPPGGDLRLRFITPMRLVSAGDLVRPATFEFHALLRTLLRRLSLLSYFHEGVELDLDFAGLVAAARTVAPLEETLRWHDWGRYSSRQKGRVPMGGLLGDVAYRGRDLAPFWPFLWLGQYVHAGKGASMGLGQYRIGSLSQACEKSTGADQCVQFRHIAVSA